jgi:hypothetical protein
MMASKQLPKHVAELLSSKVVLTENRTFLVRCKHIGEESHQDYKKLNSACQIQVTPITRKGTSCRLQSSFRPSVLLLHDNWATRLHCAPQFQEKKAQKPKDLIPIWLCTELERWV